VRQRVALEILAPNAAVSASGLVKGLRSQSLQRHVWLVPTVDSSDSTVPAFTQTGADVVLVDRTRFDNGVTWPMRMGRSDGVEIVRNPKNGRCGQGNNVEARLSTGKCLLFLNPDTDLIEPLFGFAISAFENDSRRAAEFRRR